MVARVDTESLYTTLTLSAPSEVRPQTTQGSAERFWSNVDRSGGADACWPWTGYRNAQGYGFGSFGWTRHAHRQAFYLATGRYPAKRMDVCHACDNPPCVNPAHLWVGTHSENLLDASRKGRLNTATGERHSQAKLDWTKVRAIRSRVARGESQHALAAEFGVSQVAIHFVVTGKTWANDPLAQQEEAA